MASVFLIGAFGTVPALALPASTSELDAEAPEQGEAASASNTPSSERFSFHGFFTQAYAESSDWVRVGIPTDGTFDYRNLALQFRYRPSDRDTIIIQLSHERTAESPAASLKNDIELDWAFYEHRFADETTIRVGRVQIPFGIYNEIRDVGTLLPFYLPPQSVYSEGAFANEALDGLVLGHVFELGHDYGLECHLFFGSWDIVQNTELDTARVRQSLGTQLWLRTPIFGLRFGAGLRQSEFEGLDGQTLEADDESTDLQLSIDGDFDSFLVRAELFEIDFDSGVEVRSHYLQLGWKFGERLSLYAQAEWTDLLLDFGPLGLADIEYNRETALSLRYLLDSGLVLRLEHHWYEGYAIDDPTPDLLARLIGGGPAFETDYSILSLSMSF